jgi:membrane protein implicated in regulation of membrane protease activity
LLPIAGLTLCLIGGARWFRGLDDGWILIGLGMTAMALDLVIDFAWAHPSFSESDLPDLNRRDAQLIGRSALVAEPIEGGRGKVRIGDTLWIAEGPDIAAGTTVRIVASRDAVLVVDTQNR